MAPWKLTLSLPINTSGFVDYRLIPGGLWLDFNKEIYLELIALHFQQFSINNSLLLYPTQKKKNPPEPKSGYC